MAAKRVVPWKSGKAGKDAAELIGFRGEIARLGATDFLIHLGTGGNTFGPLNGKAQGEVFDEVARGKGTDIGGGAFSQHQIKGVEQVAHHLRRGHATPQGWGFRCEMRNAVEQFS